MADHNDVLCDDDCPPWLTATQETDVKDLQSTGLIMITLDYSNNLDLDAQMMTATKIFRGRPVDACMRVFCG